MISVKHLVTASDRLTKGSKVMVYYRGELFVGKVTNADYKRDRYTVLMNYHHSSAVIIDRRRCQLEPCVDTEFEEVVENVLITEDWVF